MIILAGLALLIQVGGSQALPATVLEPLCKVGEALVKENGAPDLYATCGSSSIWIGRGMSYQSSYNVASGSLVILLRGSDRSRVLLVTPDAAGEIHIEDVSRELTQLSGRYIEAGLGDIAVNLSQFASEGRILVPVEGIAARGGAAESEQLDLLAYAARAKTPTVIAATDAGAGAVAK